MLRLEAAPRRGSGSRCRASGPSRSWTCPRSSASARKPRPSKTRDRAALVDRHLRHHLLEPRLEREREASWVSVWPRPLPRSAASTMTRSSPTWRDHDSGRWTMVAQPSTAPPRVASKRDDAAGARSPPIQAATTLGWLMSRRQEQQVVRRQAAARTRARRRRRPGASRRSSTVAVARGDVDACAGSRGRGSGRRAHIDRFASQASSSRPQPLDRVGAGDQADVAALQHDLFLVASSRPSPPAGAPHRRARCGRARRSRAAAAP